MSLRTKAPAVFGGGVISAEILNNGAANPVFKISDAVRVRDDTDCAAVFFI